jgi:hypothetical protein
MGFPYPENLVQPVLPAFLTTGTPPGYLVCDNLLFSQSTSSAEKPILFQGSFTSYAHLYRLQTIAGKPFVMPGRPPVLLRQATSPPSGFPCGHRLMEPQGAFRKKGPFLTCLTPHGFLRQSLGHPTTEFAAQAHLGDVPGTALAPGYRRRRHTGVDGAGLRVTKKALATKRGRGPNNSSCDPNCSPRKSPLARSSNAHCGRISHRSRHTQSNRMQSHRNRRMKPESKCSGRTTQIQAGQEPTLRTLNIACDKRSLPDFNK